MSEQLQTASKPRRRQTRDMVPIGPTETIRHRLQLAHDEFGTAIGFAKGSYGTMVRDGRVSKTGSLAAECLMRRQAAAGGEQVDQLILVRVVKGTPTAFLVENSRSMTLDKKHYFLIPRENGGAS